MISRQFDDKIEIVGLDLCLVSRLVANGGAATLTAVKNDISALGIGHRTCRTEYSAAGICTVAGVYINVERAKAERTVIS